MIKSYKHTNSPEEKELRELKKVYNEIPSKEIFKENNMAPNIQWLSTLKERAAEGIKAQKLLNELKKLSTKLYDVWFYYEPDIYNNGGTRTILTKEQLEHLIKRGNELTNVYFIHIYDIDLSFQNEKKSIPTFLPTEIKSQINNPDYNHWHSRLLKE